MGGVIALTKTSFSPRMYLGVCLFMGVLAVQETKTDNKYFLKATNLFVIVFVYSLISFSNSYGNALKQQNKYWETRSAMVVNDLSKLISSKIIAINFKGKPGRAKAVLNASYHYRLMRRLIRARAGGWRSLNLENMGLTLERDADKCNKNTAKTLLLSTVFYDIEKAKDSDCYFVTFK